MIVDFFGSMLPGEAANNASEVSKLSEAHPLLKLFLWESEAFGSKSMKLTFVAGTSQPETTGKLTQTNLLGL